MYCESKHPWSRANSVKPTGYILYAYKYAYCYAFATFDAPVRHWRHQSSYCSSRVFRSISVKFSFSEKATKIGAICLKVLTLLINVKTLRQIAPNFQNSWTLHLLKDVNPMIVVFLLFFTFFHNLYLLQKCRRDRLFDTCQEEFHRVSENKLPYLILIFVYFDFSFSLKPRGTFLASVS